MIFQNAALHNIEDLVSVEGKDGLRMQRIPESVREKLNPDAQFQMCCPSCAEIRFVSDGPVRIILSCPEGTGDIEVFYGPFQSRERYRLENDRSVIAIEKPLQMRRYDRGKMPALHFHRTSAGLMSGDPIFIHSVEGSHRHRPPKPDELPSIRYRFMVRPSPAGIRHGAAFDLCGTDRDASGADVNLRHRQVRVLRTGNRGLHCGPKRLGLCHLAISVNMLKFSLDFFYRRAAYMIDAICRANPLRPVICITLFPMRENSAIRLWTGR
ncbi:MAG: hypothetical protein R2874_14215 [Desulfobacterales bacterium]